ncbi:MAG: UrcA family protein [Sphingorhabdus sp.]
MARKHFVSICAAFVATGLTSVTASAAERHRKVEYSDLDLSTQAGQAKFKERVNNAVRSVCAFPSTKSAADRIDEQRCAVRARTTAMRKAAQVIARNGNNVKVALD